MFMRKLMGMFLPNVQVCNLDLMSEYIIVYYVSNDNYSIVLWHKVKYKIIIQNVHNYIQSSCSNKCMVYFENCNLTLEDAYDIVD